MNRTLETRLRKIEGATSLEVAAPVNIPILFARSKKEADAWAGKPWVTCYRGRTAGVVRFWAGTV
jgi:hypothetical protein